MTEHGTELLADAPAAPAGTWDAILATRRLDGWRAPAEPAPEEVLVADDRHGQSPARAVEQRLSNLLRGSLVPSSLLQVQAMLKSR